MKRYNNITDIPAREYEGYIWDADGNQPIVYDGKAILDVANFQPASYILEALLYYKDKETEISIHIRHSGKEHIYEFDLNHLPEGSELVKAEYLPHRLKGIGKVHFKQLWVPEDDPFCEGMPVLKMKALIFTGFDKDQK